MNKHQREICKKLREMDSAEAAEWLLLNHPADGCFYISRRSWEKEEQILLAEYFLKSVPHASDICYEALLSVMALPKFVEVLKKYIPKNAPDKSLLEYYIFPILNKYTKNEKDHLAVEHIRAFF